ncbi:MFS transporter [Telluribacter humicola]|uniref:MFS transporter n=1 Tax=Telluribacter humicola TaxID=1720261 RepID=UPI001A95BCEF|nr:MFS transporter [Telluribacter humicola]
MSNISYTTPDRYTVIRSLQVFFTNPYTRAVGLVFATDSLLFGSWVARIPFLKYQLGLNDAQLGLSLFLLPIGSIMCNPFSGRLIRRFGSARVCLWSAFGFFLSVLIPINAPNVYAMGAGMAVMGGFAAILNVAMNTCASNLEKSQGIRIMSACHGMWSLGGMLGSTLAGLIIWAEVSAPVHMLIITLLLCTLTVLIQPLLREIPEEKNENETSFARPTVTLVILIFIGLTVSMGEGVSFDWSAIYLREIAHATPSVSALGFGCFALTMTLGRFLGDTIIPRYGEKRLLILGGIVGALGIGIAVIFPYPFTTLLGFLILGMGCSLGAPMLYAISMRQPNTPPAAGLATFATFSFIGFMAGPPLIGFVAEAYGLQYGFGLVAILLLMGSLLSRWARV